VPYPEVLQITDYSTALHFLKNSWPLLGISRIIHEGRSQIILQNQPEPQCPASDLFLSDIWCLESSDCSIFGSPWFRGVFYGNWKRMGSESSPADPDIESRTGIKWKVASVDSLTCQRHYSQSLFLGPRERSLELMSAWHLKEGAPILRSAYVPAMCLPLGESMGLSTSH